MEEGGLFKMTKCFAEDGTHDELLSGRAGYDRALVEYGESILFQWMALSC